MELGHAESHIWPLQVGLACSSEDGGVESSLLVLKDSVALSVRHAPLKESVLSLMLPDSLK